MAGKTDLVIGQWHNVFTHVPMPLAIAQRKTIHPESTLWLSVLEATGQPREMDAHAVRKSVVRSVPGFQLGRRSRHCVPSSELPIVRSEPVRRRKPPLTLPAPSRPPPQEADMTRFIRFALTPLAAARASSSRLARRSRDRRCSAIRSTSARRARCRGPARTSWFEGDPAYDVQNVVADTEALLTPVDAGRSCAWKRSAGRRSTPAPTRRSRPGCWTASSRAPRRRPRASPTRSLWLDAAYLAGAYREMTMLSPDAVRPTRRRSAAPRSARASDSEFIAPQRRGPARRSGDPLRRRADRLRHRPPGLPRARRARRAPARRRTRCWSAISITSGDWGGAIGAAHAIWRWAPASITHTTRISSSPRPMFPSPAAGRSPHGSAKHG